MMGNTHEGSPHSIPRSLQSNGGEQHTLGTSSTSEVDVIHRMPLHSMTIGWSLSSLVKVCRIHAQTHGVYLSRLLIDNLNLLASSLR